ncbi:MAG: DMT family transporter, partial [Actinomycetota bacterium]|nr:DMT family transporter [Actinomycetota bacterium]
MTRIAIAATTWGSIGVFVRLVDAHPAVIVFWRVAFAGITIAIVAAYRDQLRALVRLPARKRLALAGMGALLALNWVLFMGALQLVDIAVAVLLAYCGPVFVAALTPLVMRERFDRRVIVPLLLALGGTAVIVSPSDISFADGTAALGATMAFGSAVTYALLILNAKRLLRGIPATVYMLGEYTAAGILLLPAVLLLDGPSMPMEWAALLALGVLNTALTGLLFLSGLRTVRADHAAI